MSRLDFSDHSIDDAINNVRKRGGDTTWCLFGLPAKGVKCKLFESGNDHDEMVEEIISEGASTILFAYIRFEMKPSAKYVLISWCGQGVRPIIKRKFIVYNRDGDKFMKGKVHVKIDARNEDDLDEEEIRKRVKKAAGTLFTGSGRHFKGTHGKDWVKSNNKSVNKGYTGTYGKDWVKKETKPSGRGFVGTYGKDWVKNETKPSGRGFSGSYGQDWVKSETKPSGRGFVGTYGQDWVKKETKPSGQGFSGSYGQDWEQKDNQQVNKGFSGQYGQDWKQKDNQQVNKGFSGQYGEEWK